MASSILVIDDNVELQIAFEKILGVAGYAVQLASDGEEGLRLARSKTPWIFLARHAVAFENGKLPKSPGPKGSRDKKDSSDRFERSAPEQRGEAEERRRGELLGEVKAGES